MSLKDTNSVFKCKEFFIGLVPKLREQKSVKIQTWKSLPALNP